jgi:hypothetical protein
MSLNEPGLSRQIQRCFQLCPRVVAAYTATHMDTIPKIINHVLVVMITCDIFLFMASWNVSFLPNLGFNTVLVSFLLSGQAVCVWLILNNNRISALSFLSPTEFMVGLALGISIGGSILAFVISRAYKHLSRCDGNPNDAIYVYLCGERKGSIRAIWFWGGLVFWLNFCTSILIAMGRPQLTAQNYYETLGMEDFENHFQNPQGYPVQVPSFVGDYATVPEIRSAIERVENSSNSSVASNSSRSGGKKKKGEDVAIISNV